MNDTDLCAESLGCAMRHPFSARTARDTSPNALAVA